MKEVKLVFIPFPGAGHIVSAFETAKHLVSRDERLSITFLIMQFPLEKKFDTFAQSLKSANSNPRICFIDLPFYESKAGPISPKNFLTSVIDSHRPKVKDIASEMVGFESTQLAAFVVDMLCTSMIDVGNELGIPSYIYFSSGAGMLGLMLHLQELADEQNKDITEFKDSDAELAVPSFLNPVPAKVLPSIVWNKEEGGSRMLLNLARRYREAKGIIVNTFLELEPYAIESLRRQENTPPIYPVGPMLKLKSGPNDEANRILKWLDDCPASSVVFLCFGSMESFGEEQIKEIAHAVEHSGCRFLWSLRRPPPKGKIEVPSDYSDPAEVLPEGFLERTHGVGKVIGWAPQVEILSHPSVGGFVSHCGWNSTLESVWCGVPVATWPVHAEQQLNAFELVKELGMAVEVKMDYRKDLGKESEVIVTAQEIEDGIRKLMVECEGDSEVRKKVKEASEKSRIALTKGGSSYSSIGQLIQDMSSIPLLGIPHSDFNRSNSLI